MDIYAIRRNIIGGIIVLVAFVFLAKLFSIQVVDKSYQLSADNNVLRRITQYPARGLVYDRDSNLVVYNQAAYDIMVTPTQVQKFDTTEFCNILDISEAYLKNRLDSAKNYSYYKPSPFLKLVSSETYATLQEKFYKFPGFFVQPRTVRKYEDSVAAHALGYVGEVDDNLADKSDYYRSGDYVGISGIERSYEEYLRGQKGVKMYLVDVHNRIKGAYRDGKFDQKAKKGSNITSTISLDLQRYGEKLMQNKIGSIVAIEPKSGELLSLVSSPNYDPGELVGRMRSNNYQKLNNDTLEPLFNRALMASYPPGSTFKVMNAMIGLQEGVVRPQTKFGCNGGFYYGSFHVGCHDHRSPTDLIGSIQVSCNAYYCNTFLDILDNPEYEWSGEALDQWERYVESFGFGNRLNIDLPNELPGLIPNSTYYNNIYPAGRWKAMNVVSLAIGQGEIGTTPIQLANMTAAIANRGHFYTPHIVKEIEGEATIDERFKKKRETLIDSSYIETVIEGMDLAVNGPAGSGSTARTAALDSIRVCGKTGTAENPHGKDHSIFIAFAPKDDPKIAIAVFIENGGYGATWAAPTAKLMIEKYLNKTISVKWWEKYVTEKNLIKKRHEKED
ncbi:MAG: penicillin-binding protein 2 [Bacteroidota bacterium]